jgi:hypothetical protein
MAVIETNRPRSYLSHIPLGPIGFRINMLRSASGRAYLAFCGESERIAASGGAYRGVMPLMLSASRSRPEFRAAAYSLSFVTDEVLAEKETICPAAVPMRRIAAFLRAKAAEVGGPWPLPSRIDSLPPPVPGQRPA